MFNDPLSDRDLYWIGYFRADGCLNRGPYSTQAIFAQKHKEPVEAFREYVGSDNEVRFTNRESNFGANPMHVFSTASIGKRLDELGVKTMLRPDIYESLHFWRGLLEGDGTVTTITNRGVEYPSLTWAGRLEDMERCADWITNTLGRKRPKVGAARSIFRVGIVGMPAQNLTRILYEDQYSALGYKREAAEKILAWKTRQPNMTKS